MFKSIFVFGTLILLLVGSNLKATTYYVDDAAGNDGNSGKTILLPWKTLAKVNGYLFSAGDTVSFKCGQRYSGITLTGKGSITFNSYGTGARPVIDAKGVGNCVNFDSKTNIVFNGLKFVNGTLANINLWNCSYVTFESCNIDSAWYVPGHADYDAGSVTMNLYSGVGSNLTIRNCTMSYAGGSHGIYIDGTDNTLLEYDTLMYNAHDGIRIGFGNDYDWTDNLTIRYCVSKFNKYAQLEEDGARNSNIYYNVFEMDPGYYTGNNTLLHIHQDINYHCPQSNVYYYNNTLIGHNYGSHDISSVELKSTSGMQNIVFKNNIFYYDGNVRYGIYLENWYQNGVYGGLGSFIFTNNIYYTAGSSSNLFHSDFTSQNYSTISAWKSATGYETNSLYADPLFTNYNSGDYSLQNVSPAITSGTNVSLTMDILGNPVAQTPDMGAFQHVAAAPSASTYYVAANGNDGNSGTSSSSPWKTISKVNSKVFNPGDNILFRKGDTWSEILTPQGSGNATSPIVYDAYGSGNLPIIDGGTTRNNCISLISVNYITIRNFRLQYAAVNTNGDIHVQGTDNIRIENCDFYITSHGGVFIESSTNGYIGNCTMSSPISNNDNQADGIYSQRNSSCVFENNSVVISDIGAGHNDGIQSYLDANMTFRNNYIYQNNSLTTAQGIDMSDGSGTFYVYNNVIKCPNSNGNIIGFNNNVSGTGALRCYQNTVLGNVNCLKVLKCTDVIVKNNIFYSNSATSIIDIGSNLSSGSAIDYNLYNRSGAGSIVLYEPQGYVTYAQWQALGFETHGINANPVVNDTLYPASNSPVINVGTNLGGIFSVDKEGTIRPVNGVDLGAYELKSALPVELTSFTGNYSNNAVHLTWTTATEINNQGFDIERNNNSEWTKIGFIEGKGNSVIKNDYYFEDKNPVGYKMQYRLKQIDNNGNFSYSEVVSITVIPQEFVIGNYPNPFNPSTKIRYSIPSESMINLVVYNIIGERLDELKNEVQQPGTYELNWSGNGHPSGVYFVSITESPTNGGTKNSKTIKMNLIK